MPRLRRSAGSRLSSSTTRAAPAAFFSISSPARRPMAGCRPGDDQRPYHQPVHHRVIPHLRYRTRLLPLVTPWCWARSPYRLAKAGFDTPEKFAAARANPGKYQFGSTENTTRLVGELFRLSGLKIENVAYKGAAPMMVNWPAYIPVGLTSPTVIAAPSRHAAHAGGEQRQRLASCRFIQTMAEIGAPGVDQSAWFSVRARGSASTDGTPARRCRGGPGRA